MEEKIIINPCQIRLDSEQMERSKYATHYDNLTCYHPNRYMDFITLKDCIILDLNDGNLLTCIEEEDDALFSLLKKYLYEHKEIHEAHEYFEGFDYYILQGHSIYNAINYFNDEQREEMRRNATYVSTPAASDRKFLEIYREKAIQCLIELDKYENKKLINIPKRRSSFAKKRNQLMLAVIDRDGYKCQHCGIDKSLTVDHILALSIGGSDDIENLQLLCRPCNSRKNDK